MKRIDEQSPGGLWAIAEMNRTLGFDIRVVMNREWWHTAEVDGEPTVMVNADGVRCMARFAPRPDAIEFAERLITGIADQIQREP